MKTLETDRLILRAFTEDDSEAVYDYARNPNVGPAAGWAPHESVEDSQRIVRMFIQADDVWAIVDKTSGRLIGTIGLHRDTKRSIHEARSIGYVLAEEFWGRGIMPEAVKAAIRFGFETLRLEIISVDHYPYNAKSKRVIEKCGFRYEGTLRKAARLFNGEVVDHVCYAITREEYFQGIPE